MNKPLFYDIECSLHEEALVVAAQDLLYKYIDLSEKNNGSPRKDEDVEALVMALDHYGISVVPF